MYQLWILNCSSKGCWFRFALPCFNNQLTCLDSNCKLVCTNNFSYLFLCTLKNSLFLRSSTQLYCLVIMQSLIWKLCWNTPTRKVSPLCHLSVVQNEECIWDATYSQVHPGFRSSLCSVASPAHVHSLKVLQRGVCCLSFVFFYLSDPFSAMSSVKCLAALLVTPAQFTASSW